MNLEDLQTYIQTDIAAENGTRTYPPVEKWHPERVGEMDLVIKSNGEWWHEGRKITRESMVTLFSSILWREQDAEQDHYYLKTPVEKLRIQVEDVPLLVTDINLVPDEHQPEQYWLQMTTSTQDQVRVDDTHPLTLREYQGEMRPYVRIRDNLDAVLSRNAYGHLLKIGTLSTNDKGQTILTVSSGTHTYELIAD